MYSFSYLEPVCFPCPVLTVASWPAYRFLKRQVRWSGILISFRILHSLLWSNLDSILKSRDNYFVNKGPSSQGYGLSSSHVWMWELDHKQGWVPKNWCFWTVVLEKTLESPLDCKEIKPVNPKENQPWIFIGKNCCWSSNTLATLFGQPTYWKRPWCWETLRARGEGDDIGWAGWIASSAQ